MEKSPPSHVTLCHAENRKDRPHAQYSLRETGALSNLPLSHTTNHTQMRVNMFDPQTQIVDRDLAKCAKDLIFKLIHQLEYGGTMLRYCLFFLLCFFWTSDCFAALDDCHGAALSKTHARQKALLDQYAEAIEASQKTEFMTRVTNCVAKLNLVFRFRRLGDLDDVVEQVEKALEETAEELCSEALRRLSAEISGLEHTVWDSIRENAKDSGWRQVITAIQQGNLNLSGYCKRKLKDVLQD